MDLAAFKISHSSFELSNGLRGVVLERPEMPVHVRVTFKAGGRYDPSGKEGLAHFLEHMVVAGTKKFPTKTDLATYIEGFGGVFNASTPKEEINLNAAVGDPADLQVAFEVLGQMLTASLFSDVTIENERQSVLGEIGDKEANPLRKIWDTRDRLYFQDTTVGRSNAGLVETINAITKIELTDFLAKALSPNRGLVIVCGGVTASQAQRLAERHLGGLTPRSGHFDDGPVAINHQRPILIDHRPNDQVRLSFGFRTCELGHPDGAALDVIATILGGGRASSLSRILRQELGLVYTVTAIAPQLAAGGTWSVETSAAATKLQAVLDAIAGEFDRVHSGGITPAELQFAISKMIKSTRMEMQTSQSWVAVHSPSDLHIGSHWTLTHYLAAVEHVTAADVARVGRRYFKPGTWYLGLVGNVSQDDFSVNY